MPFSQIAAKNCARTHHGFSPCSYRAQRQQKKEVTWADGLSELLIYVNEAGRDDEDERDRMRDEKIRKAVDRDVRWRAARTDSRCILCTSVL